MSRQSNNKEPDLLTIEYEGQKYSVESHKLAGLGDQQILELLSVGFPGIAQGKLERLEDGSIKITKRVGTKGNNHILELLENCPEDDLFQRINDFNQRFAKELTISEWSKVYESWDFESIEEILEQREKLILLLIDRIYYYPTKIIPLM